MPTFSPAAPSKTPPPRFVLPEAEHSPPGPRSLVWRWLRNHACRSPSLNPSRLSQLLCQQVDGASQLSPQAITAHTAITSTSIRRCSNLAGAARILDRAEILRQVLDRPAFFPRHCESASSYVRARQAREVSCVAPGRNQPLYDTYFSNIDTPNKGPSTSRQSKTLMNKSSVTNVTFFQLERIAFHLGWLKKSTHGQHQY